jgi:hypothetical protein
MMSSIIKSSYDCVFFIIMANMICDEDWYNTFSFQYYLNVEFELSRPSLALRPRFPPRGHMFKDETFGAKLFS